MKNLEEVDKYVKSFLIYSEMFQKNKNIFFWSLAKIGQVPFYTC